MRVYVPATLPMLGRWDAAGEVTAREAHAVTPAVREWYTSGGADELEYAALLEAAGAVLALLADQPDAPRRRVVLVMDIADAAATSDPRGGSRVLLSAAAPMTAVASIHVDAAEAEADVEAAVKALLAAQRGDPDARFVVDGADAHDLLWYDVSEVTDLLGPTT